MRIPNIAAAAFFLISLNALLAVELTMTPQQKKIDELLANQTEFFQHDWLGDAITPTQLIKESEQGWANYMRLFKTELSKAGLGNRDDLITSKEKVHQFWKERRDILLMHLKDSTCKVYRYDGGKGEECGYIVLKNGKPHRWLSVRVNRPDPNIGNVELPFP